MKRFLTLIFLFALVQISFSQTMVSGILSQNTTWSLSGSPYIVTGTITVQENVTLTIQPGVVIKSQASLLSTTFQIKGVINAIGSVSQPIVFTSPKDDSYGGDTNNDGSLTSPNAEDWTSIIIEATGGSSAFENCLFRFGGFAVSGAVDAVLNIDGSSPSVKSCTFFKNGRGLDVINSGNPNLMSNQFDGNITVPVARDLKTQVSFANNTFLNTNKYNSIGILNNSTNIANATYLLTKENVGPITNIPFSPINTITIQNDNTLAISPGVTIKSIVDLLGTSIVIKGKLTAVGTQSEPIVFTSPKDDSYGGDTNNDGSSTSPNAEDWTSIIIEATGSSSAFENCLFRYGGFAVSGSVDAVLNIDGSSPSVKDCTFFKNGRGLDVINSGNPNLMNNQFDSNITVPVARDLRTQVSFANNTFLTTNKYNAIGILNNSTNIPNGTYQLTKENVGAITNIPFSLINTITIQNDNTLTISPGVIIKSIVDLLGTSIVVKGKLTAVGTQNEPIVFTSPKDDSYGGDTNNNGSATPPNAEDWTSIIIEATGSSSAFENCLFRYGGFAISNSVDAVLNIDGSNPLIKNCVFFKNGRGVDVENSSIQIKFCSFIENRIGCQINNLTGLEVKIDSSLFCHNSQVGVRIASGTVAVSQSSFWKNTNFDIENQSSSNIDATSNWWQYDNYSAILTNPSSNFPNIFDQIDNPAKGIVNVSNPNKPLTDFNYDISGYQAFFNNSTPLVDNFVWNFGDNTQSPQVNPAHKYAEPGYYNVCLEPTNCDGNLRGSICKTVLIKGLKTLYPTVSGNTNTYIGLIRGAGFTPNDVVKLIRTGQNDIVADTMIYFDSTLIKVLFTFEDAAVGSWDLSVNGIFLSELLPNALTIETAKPISISSFVEGRNRIRTNRPTKMRIGIRNNSNQTVFGVPVFLSLSADFEVVINNLINPDSVPPEINDSIKYGLIKVFDPIQEKYVQTGIFLIPNLQPYGTTYIELTIKSSSIINDTLRVSTGHPWLSAEDLKDAGVLFRSSPEFPDCLKCVFGAIGAAPFAGAFYNMLYNAYEASNAFQNNDFESGSVHVIQATAGLASFLLQFFPPPASPIGYLGSLALNQLNSYNNPGSLPSCIPCAENNMPGFPMQTGNSFDPNDKKGQYGATENHYLNGQENLNYSIFFENVDSATAPAGEVFITDIIDSTTLNIQSLKFTGFGFGDNQFQFVIPVSDTSFTYDINLNPEKNIILRVNGKVDYFQNQVSWSFRSFDPVTMDLTDDIDLGFLPPNVNSPEGEGYVTFTIEPKPNLPHLTEINNGASIVFDNNLPIITPIWKNTIDKVKPESNVLSLSAMQSDTSFNITWTGNDTESGVSFYDIYYSVNGNNTYELWRRGNSNSSDAVFTGIDGKSYCFYSVAHDFVGNVEDVPLQPDACTQVIVSTIEPSASGYKLLQNIPNPFSNETVIGFILPEASDVKLIVTNQIGQTMTLLDGTFNPGLHQVPFRPIGEFRGVYFYTIVTPNYTKTLKMVSSK